MEMVNFKQQRRKSEDIKLQVNSRGIIPKISFNEITKPPSSSWSLRTRRIPPTSTIVSSPAPFSLSSSSIPMFFKMPRPGPRPYECVRRAWHSDRHPPVRGSLIQEIFRMANEVHNSTTRKNKEWLEKLPIVVLKAEEIMYSKANSEAEYSDLKTLWDRVNDAIDTIIRRDESTETGELLQPCIEAALHLGCIPRRSSRSQRNDAPRCYLRPEAPEANVVPPSTSNAKGYGNLITRNPPVMRPSTQHLTRNMINSSTPCFKSDNYSIQNRSYNDTKFYGLPDNFPSDNCHSPIENHASSNTWSVFPLCYSYQSRSDEPRFCSTKPSNAYSQIKESGKIGYPRNLSPSRVNVSGLISPTNHDRTLDHGQGIKCDLTLRLGSPVGPCESIQNSWCQDLESPNYGSSAFGRKFK